MNAAAYVAETTREVASATLERLRRLSLAQERRVGRYRLHPLLRDFAREAGQAQGTAPTTELRMARYYCDVARENGPKLEGAELYTALAILDPEVSNIFAGQKWARARTDPAGWELCRDYIGGATTYYFNLRAMWNEWIE